jgi:hypothetical protein
MDKSTFEAAQKTNNDLFEELKAEMLEIIKNDFAEFLGRIERKEHLDEIFGENFISLVRGWEASLQTMMVVDNRVN